MPTDKASLLKKRVRTTVFAVVVLILSLAAGFSLLSIVWDGPHWVEALVGVIAGVIAAAVLFFTFRWVRLVEVEADDQITAPCGERSGSRDR